MTGPFIGNTWLSEDGRHTMPILNPATGAEFDRCICATPEDADAAALAAHDAMPQWSAKPPAERALCLRQIASAVAAKSENIAALITQEQGKPIAEAKMEMSGVVAMFNHFADVADQYPFSTRQDGEGSLRRIDMIPVGPAIIITTWNFPVETAAVHIAPALAAGCPVVVLANSDTPSSVAALVRAMQSVDLPDGLVSLVMGASEDLSKRLIENPLMRHLSYTGSVNVGRVLAAQCGANIMRSTLELGGNAPAIVLPGSGIEKVANALISKRFWNAGQVCTAPNRIYVNRAQHDAFADVAGACARALLVGNGADPRTTMGPLANPERVKRMDMIAVDAVAKGAVPIVNDPALQSSGFFAAPRVFAHVPDDALGMVEEIFGPVACITPYDDLDKVINRANACDLGLSGYVFGPDQDEAERVSQQLNVGTVAVNQLTTAFIDVPFGGIKSSGLGCVGGKAAIAEYVFPRLTAMKA